ncbi:MAG TPA: hypothetical protein VIY08_02300 [Candidatus Nitrosocosmicus sp.]
MKSQSINVIIIKKASVIIFAISLFFNFVYAETPNTKNNYINTVYSSIGKSNLLTMNMQFDPKDPIYYKQTKILFHISNLINTNFKNLTAFVTILDNSGSIYKYGHLKIINGNFFINFIFQNYLQNKIIVQLYLNKSGVALTTFDFQIYPLTPKNFPQNPFLDFFQKLFK